MVKRFLEWIGIKEEIHNHDHKPPFFKEGEIWWCFIGENVGSEINGKGEKFTRPILIIKKYDTFSFLAIPLSTKDKVGTWYCRFTHNGKFQNAQLAQARVISYKRLKEQIGKLEEREFRRVKDAFLTLHKI